MRTFNDKRQNKNNKNKNTRMRLREEDRNKIRTNNTKRRKENEQINALTFIVEPMCDLMTNNDTNSAIV